MTHFALVSKADPVELPKVDANTGKKKNVREEVTSIYESYAALYPNPRLGEEAHERDRLLRAISAASNAVQQNPKQPQEKKGVFGFLFGSSNAKLEEEQQEVPVDASLEDQLQYEEMMNDENTENDSLCGTRYSLDTSCIPQEAHSLARFHLASTRTRGERPNVARTAWATAGNKQANITVAVVGLGVLAEFRNDATNTSTSGNGRLRHTSDRLDLMDYVEGVGAVFRVAYARAATIGPNFLMVSWGLPDGLIVCYRRTVSRGKGEADDGAWEAVAVLGPTETVLQNLGDEFMEEEGSALIQITDIVPLVVDGGEIPAVTVAVARLGGYVELVPLSPRIWYGPEINPPAKKKRKRRRQNSPPEHYAAAAKLFDIGPSQPRSVAFSTLDYHVDLIGLETFRTSVGDDTTWNQEAYPNGPPAEYVIAASGTRDGHEVLSFWSVSFLFVETPEQIQDGVDFSLHATLTEAIDLGPVGADVSIFASKPIMSHWRQPKSVSLAEGDSLGKDATRDNVPLVTTVSVSAPVVAIRFVAVSQGTQLALLDYNGGVTFMDCSLLQGFVSQSLSEEEFDTLHPSADPDAVVPMVKTTVDRSQSMRRLSPSAMMPAKALSIQWLNSTVSKQLRDDPMLAVLTEKPSKLFLLSAADAQNEGLLASVPFTSSQGGTIACRNDGRLFFLTLGGEGDMLSICTMDEQEPRDIVESLARASKFKEVIAAAKRLSQAEQESLGDVVEQCKKNMWESSRDFDSLTTIVDESYIVNQALSFDENTTEDLDMNLFRSIHSLALERLFNTRLGPALAMGGLAGTTTVVNQVRERLVKLGTYELLCRHFGMVPSLSHFCSDILSLSMKEIAKSFARAVDAIALTLICFRHRSETLCDFEVLDETPLVTSPCLFQHLFPVSDDSNKGTNLFMSHDSKRPLLQWAEMPQYLCDNAGVMLVLDINDEKLVMDHYRSALVLDGETVDNNEMNESIEQWYVGRVRSIQRVSGNLVHTAEFSRLALRGLGVKIEDFDASVALPTVETLYATMRCAETLTEMSVDNSDSLSPPSIAALNPLDIGNMELDDIVAMVFDDMAGSVEIFSCYKRFLLPFLDIVTTTNENQGHDALDEAIKSYCVGLVRVDAQDSDAANRGHANRPMGSGRRAIEVSSAISYLSRTSSDVSSRLIKDKRVLLNLFLSIFEATFQAYKDASTQSPLDFDPIVQGLWTMYESLPTNVPPSSLDDGDMSKLLERADGMFRALVAIDICSRWPNCNPFDIVIWDPSSNEEVPADKMYPSGEKAVSKLCQSFCAQLGSRENATEANERLEVLVGLLSDIAELNRVCYGGSLPLSRLVPLHLSTSLLRQQHFQALGDYLSTADEAWINAEATSNEIVSYVNETAFTEAAKGPGAANAMACLDIIGRRFPAVRGVLKAERQILDAAQFIGAILLPGRRLEKFRPTGLRASLPLDVIESVLSENPNCVVCDCREWTDPAMALGANKAFRDFSQRGRNASDDSLRLDPASLPPLPGRAIFHLAQLLGLTKDVEVIAVKCKVIQHSVDGNLDGAGAAICRTLLNNTDAFSDTARAHSILNAVAAVVSKPMYSDTETKRELCLAIMVNFRGSISLSQSPNFDRILEAFSNTESFQPRNSRTSTNRTNALVKSVGSANTRTSFERLCQDSLAEHSGNIIHGFSFLRQHISDGSVHDSLVRSLSRYALLWCITQYTNSEAGACEKGNTNAILRLAFSLLFHVQKNDIALACLHEVALLLENQASKVLEQQPPDWTTLNVDIIRRLVGRGYSVHGARRATAMSDNKGFDLALVWAVSHSLDQGFDDPILILKSEQQGPSIDMDDVQRLKDSFRQTQAILQMMQTPNAITGSSQAILWQVANETSSLPRVDAERGISSNGEHQNKPLVNKRNGSETVEQPDQIHGSMPPGMARGSSGNNVEADKDTKKPTTFKSTYPQKHSSSSVLGIPISSQSRSTDGTHDARKVTHENPAPKSASLSTLSGQSRPLVPSGTVASATNGTMKKPLSTAPSLPGAINMESPAPPATGASSAQEQSFVAAEAPEAPSLSTATSAKLSAPPAAVLPSSTVKASAPPAAGLLPITVKSPARPAVDLPQTSVKVPVPPAAALLPITVKSPAPPAAGLPPTTTKSSAPPAAGLPPTTTKSPAPPAAGLRLTSMKAPAPPVGLPPTTTKSPAPPAAGLRPTSTKAPAPPAGLPPTTTKSPAPPVAGLPPTSTKAPAPPAGLRPITSKLPAPRATGLHPTSTKAPAPPSGLWPITTKLPAPRATGLRSPSTSSALGQSIGTGQAPSRLRMPTSSSTLGRSLDTSKAPAITAAAKPGSPDRSLLRDRGETVLRASRASSNPATDERRRLIEQGRLLLQKARGASNIPNVNDKPVHRYPLRSSTASSSSPQGSSVPTNGVTPAEYQASAAVLAPLNDDKTETKDAGWDFDDFDDF
jgi:hypothetical protein